VFIARQACFNMRVILKGGYHHYGNSSLDDLDRWGGSRCAVTFIDTAPFYPDPTSYGRVVSINFLRSYMHRSAPYRKNR
jgi:hypothetical protein